MQSFIAGQENTSSRSERTGTILILKVVLQGSRYFVVISSSAITTTRYRSLGSSGGTFFLTIRCFLGCILLTGGVEWLLCVGKLVGLLGNAFPRS